jgi:hypothetical protein
VNRLSRRLPLVIVLVLAVTGAAGCGFVQPPALTMAKDSSSPPFFTFSANDLFAELNKNTGNEGGTTSLAPMVESQRVAEVLTGKVRPRILEQLMADRGIKPSDADRAAVERAAQQQQMPPSEDEIAFQTNVVALANALAADFFSKPGNNIDDYARQYYNDRKDSFTQQAQICLHVVTADAPSSGAPDPTTGQAKPPSDAQIDATLPAAQTLRQRLTSEPWEVVAKDTGQSAAQIPGGDLGCRSEEDLPPALVAGIKDVATGTISQPIRWQIGWIVARVDERKPLRTPPFEEVRNDAVAATRQTFGGRFVTELLTKIYSSYVITVDPRFGRWVAEQGQVLPPEGSAPAPTTSTTTTRPTLQGDGSSEPGTTTTTTASSGAP